MLNAVNDKKTSLNRVVETMCENPIKSMVFTQKGTIEVGSDADLVILDMDKKTLTNDKIVSKAGPYDGMKIKVPALVMVRGQVIVRL